MKKKYFRFLLITLVIFILTLTYQNKDNLLLNALTVYAQAPTPILSGKFNDAAIGDVLAATAGAPYQDITTPVAISGGLRLLQDNTENSTAALLEMNPASGWSAGINWNNYYDGAWRYRNNGYSGTLGFYNGDLMINLQPSGTAGNVATFDATTEKLRIKNTGNVGIGTSNPLRKLEVNNTLRLTNSSSDTNDGVIGTAPFSAGLNIVGINTDTAGRKIGLWGSIIQHENPVGNSFTGTSTFDGNVGIGTNSPNSKLQISGGHVGSIFQLYSAGDGGDNSTSLNFWASEPGASYTGTGIGNNITNYTSNPAAVFPRINTNTGGSFTRYLDNYVQTRTVNNDGTTTSYLNQEGTRLSWSDGSVTTTFKPGANSLGAVCGNSQCLHFHNNGWIYAGDLTQKYGGVGFAGSQLWSNSYVIGTIFNDLDSYVSSNGSYTYYLNPSGFSNLYGITIGSTKIDSTLIDLNTSQGGTTYISQNAGDILFNSLSDTAGISRTTLKVTGDYSQVNRELRITSPTNEGLYTILNTGSSGDTYLEPNTAAATTRINWYHGTGGVRIGNGAGNHGPIYASGYPGTSSIRFKENISPTTYGLAEVLKMDPVKFQFKNDPDKKTNLGFIAEEIYKIVPEVVALDKDNIPEALDYSKLTPILVNAIKTQQAQLEKQQQEINELRKEIQNLNKN